MTTARGIVADMDKKARKKIDVLNQKLQALRPKLAGARRQLDDPSEVARLEEEIRGIEAEIERLRGSK
ncbi:MAG: hypothetical protein FJ297_03795 [Planctomycetes bacterium]|nr:hypothetical protein [Planctomycetota bacterium]